MQSVESLCKNLIECQHCSRIVSSQKCIHKRETIFIVKHIKITKHILILHIGTAERNSLIEDSQGVTHRTISLMGNHMKRLIINGDILARSNHTEVLDDILDRNPIEVISLTP